MELVRDGHGVTDSIIFLFCKNIFFVSLSYLLEFPICLIPHMSNSNVEKWEIKNRFCRQRHARVHLQAPELLIENSIGPAGL